MSNANIYISNYERTKESLKGMKKKKTKEEKKENRETLYNGQRNIQIKNFLTVFM